MNRAILFAALLSAALAPPAAMAQARGGKPGTAVPSGIAIDRAFLLGRWTDDGDCAHAVRFLADGAFVTHEGARGLWRLQGSRLTLSGSSTLILRLVPLDRDTIQVINPDGSLGLSTRCPGEGGAVPADVA